MSVERMLDEMSSHELTMWGARAEIQAKEAEKQNRMAGKGMRPRGFGGRR